MAQSPCGARADGHTFSVVRAKFLPDLLNWQCTCALHCHLCPTHAVPGDAPAAKRHMPSLHDSIQGVVYKSWDTRQLPTEMPMPLTTPHLKRRRTSTVTSVISSSAMDIDASIHEGKLMTCSGGEQVPLPRTYLPASISSSPREAVVPLSTGMAPTLAAGFPQLVQSVRESVPPVPQD